MDYITDLVRLAAAALQCLAAWAGFKQREQPMTEILTVGQVARLFKCRRWHVQRVCEDGLIPEPPKAGTARAFTRADLPRIEKALRERGYLK